MCLSRSACTDCLLVQVVLQLIQFISFLDDCVQFAIDMGEELIILYEHIYEIYGGIQGASNNFLIESYEQGKRGRLLSQ